VEATNGCTVTRTFTVTATDGCNNTTNKQVVYSWTMDTIPPAITCPSDKTVACNSLPSCTFMATQGGWGAPPNGNNIGTLLANNFAGVYPAGVEVGIPGTTGYSMKFTSAAAIRAYLPAGSTPAALNQDYMNPTNTSAGVFGGQVLALQLNVDFGDRSLTPSASGPVGNLVYTDSSSPLNGKTVRQILTLANTALGGGNAGVAIADLNVLVTAINGAFDNCTTTTWALSHILPTPPAVPATDPANTGTATATDNCGGTVTIGYSDSWGEDTSGNNIITRTWTARDSCANSSTCNQEITVPPCCPACVDPQLGLGAAAGCTVLELGAASVSITGPAGGILGDVCVAPGGKLSISGDEYITGKVKLGTGATVQNSSSYWVDVMNNVDLSAQILAAKTAATNAAAMPCTQSYATLDGNSVTTITGVVGNNVICVGDINLSGKQITISGPTGAKFIVNVAGKFVLTGGGSGPQIRVSGGVQPKDVLYNIKGTGPDVAFSGGGGGANCCQAIVDGTILAPQRKIALAPGLVNGEIISGMDISIVSGSSVRCPPCNQASAAPTGLKATVSTGKISLTWSNLAGATSYKVWRSTISGGGPSGYTLLRSGQTSPSYADNTVVNGVAYYYVVTAVINAVETGYSGEVAGVATGGLPSPWATTDIGSVAVVGGAGYANSVFSASGSGAGIGGTADAFRFLYQSGSGDCSIVARVTTFRNASASAEAVVMIREKLEANAKQASVYLTPSGLGYQYRNGSSGGSTVTGAPLALTAPYWLKVTRTASNNLFAFYVSSNGSTWTAIGSTTISMGSSVYIGLGVSSGANGAYSTATFDNVTATP
jgi:hypothetical protein